MSDAESSSSTGLLKSDPNSGDSTRHRNVGPSSSNHSEGPSTKVLTPTLTNLSSAPTYVHDLFNSIKNKTATEENIQLQLGNLADAADFLVVDDTERTILHYACDYGNKTDEQELATKLVQSILSEASSYMTNQAVAQFIDMTDDDRKKTAMHLALDHENRKLVKLLFLKGADLNLPKKGAPTEIIQLIYKKMPDILVNMFESSLRLKDVEEDFFGQRRIVTYDFSPVTTILGHNLAKTHAVKLANLDSQTYNLSMALREEKSTRSEILLHPLTEFFMHFKYKKLRAFIWISIACHIIWYLSSLVFLASHSHLSPEGTAKSMTSCKCSCSTGEQSSVDVAVSWAEAKALPDILGDTSSSSWWSWLMWLLWPFPLLFIYLLMYLFMLWKEFYEYKLCPHKEYYWKQWENRGQIILFIVVAVVTISNLFPYHWLITIVGAAGIFLAGLLCLSQLNKTEECGIFIEMFSEVTKNILKYLAFFSPLVIVFSVEFHLLLPVRQQFGLFGVLTKVVTMMTGEVTYNEVVHGGDSEEALPHPGFTKFLLFCFDVTMIIVLQNLLIALTQSDLQALTAKAKENHLAKQLELFYLIEEYLLKDGKHWFDEQTLYDLMVDLEETTTFGELPEELQQVLRTALKDKPDRFKVTDKEKGSAARKKRQ